MSEGALQDPFGLSGTVLERSYRVDDVVGQGGFGVVYRGRHLSLDQPIAIKVLKGLDGGDSTINALVLEKFRAEARLLYTLSVSSLHIVRSLDYGATTTPAGVWAPFMILEWLEGRSLADDLEDRRRRGMRGRSLAEAFAILEPVADALSVAHRQQVAHRDVKPANVFLLGGGAEGAAAARAKVLDFGIAKIMKEGEAAGTKGTFASFTWLYAAPEQLEPRLGQTGLATDVHAFALLLTELMTDRRPIDEHDVVGIMRAATDPSRRPTPRTCGASVSDAIEAVCRRALSVDPRARHANVAELWAALVAARDARGATALPAQAARPSTAAMPAASAPPHGGLSQAPTGVVPGPAPAAHAGSGAAQRTGRPFATPPPVMGPPPGTRPPGPLAPVYLAGPPPGPPPPGWGWRRLASARHPLGDPAGAAGVIIIAVILSAILGACVVTVRACV